MGLTALEISGHHQSAPLLWGLWQEGVEAGPLTWKRKGRPSHLKTSPKSHPLTVPPPPNRASLGTKPLSLRSFRHSGSKLSTKVSDQARTLQGSGLSSTHPGRLGLLRALPVPPQWTPRRPAWLPLSHWHAVLLGRGGGCRGSQNQQNARSRTEIPATVGYTGGWQLSSQHDSYGCKGSPHVTTCNPWQASGGLCQLQPRLCNLGELSARVMFLFT